MKNLKKELDYWLKHNYVLNWAYKAIASRIMRVWGLFVPTDEKMILFTALGRRYNDSPRAIYEYMIKKPRFKDFKFVWGLDDPDLNEIPGTPIKIKADTKEYFRISLMAKYWITSVNIERGMRYKKKSCIFLNTWHGVSINTVGNGVPGRGGYDFSHLNFLCYESEWNKQLLMSSFNAPERIMLASGLPRNDELYYVDQETILKIKTELGLPLDKKILLYCPTWRDSDDHGQTYAITPPINIDKWEKLLGKDYILLFRTHHYTTKLLGIQFNNFVRDFSTYPRVNDLFKVSDILISDYSACITDFSILERPVICFAYDYEPYKESRGFNMDFNREMPSGVLKTEEEVINHILKMNYQEECQKTRDQLKNRYTYIGGHATEICVEALFGKE